MWSVKHVLSGYSDNSVKDTITLFQTIFQDSKAAMKMELGPTKLHYVVNYGIAPYFKNILKEDITSSDYFVVSFDESLNKTIQNCEMDEIIRFWDEKVNQVQVRFWNSMYFGHATHTDLLKNFGAGIEGFDLSKLLQVSMDGPSVNLKFLSELKKSRDENNLPKLIDIGSCNLHTVHNGFKTGAESTGWNIKATMKGAFQLLKDSPARREDFVTVTGSSKFPLQFCSTR